MRLFCLIAWLMALLLTGLGAVPASTGAARSMTMSHAVHRDPSPAVTRVMAGDAVPCSGHVALCPNDRGHCSCAPGPAGVPEVGEPVLPDRYVVQRGAQRAGRSVPPETPPPIV